MKKRVLLLAAVFVVLLALISTTSAASITYYETTKSDVPLRKSYSVNAEEVVTIKSAGYVLKVKDYVDNSSGNRWYQIDSGSYGGKSLAGLWVYSGNVKSHTHDYSSNGGVCKSSGCGYTYPYSVTSMSGYYQGANSSGAKLWSMPYSTGASVQKGTLAYNAVVTVTGKTTNAEGNVWYKLSSGYWVYSGNVKAHTHDYSGNGGVCNYSGCGYTYPYSVTSMSGYFQGANSDGAKLWSMPYSTGASVQKGTLAYNAVVSVTGKTTNAEGNVWYQLSSGYWVYSGNVKAHTHDCTGNGGVCNYSGCGYTYPLSISGYSITVVVTNTSGATIWSKPYSTGSSTEVRTASYKTVLSVSGKATNADGNEWYKLSDGNWVYPGNVTRRYTITYDANGGVLPPPVQYKLHDENVLVSGLTPVRPGYIFDYWCSTRDGSGDQYTAGMGHYRKNADETLYAIWEKCTDHDYTGGICDKCGYEYPYIVESISATYMVSNADGAAIWSRPYSNNSVNVRTAPVNTNLTVTGKTTNEAGNEWYQLSDGNWVYSGNVQRSYKVNYNLNGGVNHSDNPTYFYIGQNISLKKPTRTGYSFAGWYLDSSLTKTITKLSTAGEVTIYAKWTANNYTIAFKGNGATSGSMSSKSATYDKSVTLPSNAFKKTNYSFSGWNTKADGSGASYGNGASVSNLTATDGATVTLYAQWTPNKPAITAQPENKTVASGSSAAFTVSASGAELSYQWQYSTDGGSSWRDKSGATSATYRFTAQESDDGVLYRCKVSNGGGTVTSDSARLTVSATAVAEPGEIKSVTVTPSSGGKIALSWSAAADAKAYVLQRHERGSDTWTTLSGSISGTTYTDTSGTTGTVYQYRVRGRNGDSFGPYKTSAEVACMSGSKPGSVGTPKVKPASGGKITVSWKAADGAATYILQRNERGSSTWVTLGSNIKENKYTDTSAKVGKVYRYRVRSRNVSVFGPFKVSVEVASMKNSAPGTVGTPTVTAAKKKITISWTAAEGAATYILQRRERGSDKWTTLNSNIKETSYVDATGEVGAVYQYRVRSRNVSTYGPFKASTEVAFMSGSTPGDISKVTVKATSGKITVTWTASSGAAGYIVQRRLKGSDTWTNLSTYVTELSYVDKTAKAGKVYQYRIRPRNGNIYGSFKASAEVTAK